MFASSAQQMNVKYTIAYLEMGKNEFELLFDTTEPRVPLLPKYKLRLPFENEGDNNPVPRGLGA